MEKQNSKAVVTWKDLKLDRRITEFNNDSQVWQGTQSNYREYLLLDLGSKRTITGLLIQEDLTAKAPIVGFSIMYLNDREHWRNHYLGSHIGEHYICHFPPVVTRYLQLNLRGKNGHPRIRNISVLS